jgi:DNA mismatch repair protein MSH4
VVEGRGSAVGEVGIASICLDNPTLVLCQFTDTRTYIRTLTKLEFFNPAEILTPSAGPFDASRAPSKLREGFPERCPNAAVTELARKYFSDTAGLELIKGLCSSEYASVETKLPEKHYR